jgi:hypothetical protein
MFYRVRHLTLPIVHSNKYNWTRLSKSVSRIHSPHKQYCKIKMGTVKCRTVPQSIQHDSQWTPCVLHSPGDFSLGLVTFCGPPIHRTLLQQTFLWGYFKAQVFTHTLPDINSIKMQFLRRLRMLRRTQQCLHCPGGHLLDVVLKTWGFFVKPRHWLT